MVLTSANRMKGSLKLRDSADGACSRYNEMRLLPFANESALTNKSTPIFQCLESAVLDFETLSLIFFNQYFEKFGPFKSYRGPHVSFFGT